MNADDDIIQIDDYSIIESCQYSQKLLAKIELINQSQSSDELVDLDEIKKGMYFAKKYHEGQVRNSGEPYYSHLIEVAVMAADYIFTTEAILVAVLHDAIEDTNMSAEIIAKLFGDSVADKVSDLTRSGNDTAADTVDKLWSEHKYDVLLIKLCDRMHNMLTLSHRPSSKIKKTAKETLSAFIVLAAYLGVSDIEEKLSSLCIQYINKDLVKNEDIEDIV